jgi:ribonucleotide reductase beta subunit family protein with ferritin-like domain
LGDGLAEIYHRVRRDETRHVAVGVSYLARALRDKQVQAEYQEHSSTWLEVCREYADIEALADLISGLTGQDKDILSRWFRMRHRNRMSAMKLVIEGG